MELIDILDKDGNFIGRPEPKQVVHTQGLWHQTVNIMVHNGRGQLLFQKRSPNKDLYPNLLDIAAGGHVHSGETIIDACLREFNEETGIPCKPDDFVYLGREKTEDILPHITNREFKSWYLFTFTGDISQITYNPEEISGFIWVDLNKFQKEVSTPEVYSAKYAPRSYYPTVIQKIKSLP